MQNMHPVNQKVEKSLESYPFHILTIIFINTADCIAAEWNNIRDILKNIKGFLRW